MELYQNISIAGFIAAGIFFLIAVILFFKFEIPALYGELSGKTAEQQVKIIREQNRSAEVMRRTEPRRRKKAEQTNKATKMVRTVPRTEATIPRTEATIPLAEATVPLAEATVPLAEATVPLADATILLGAEDAPGEATMVLDSRQKFIIIQENTEIHTSEVI
jgi:hypothetical protein